MSGRPLFSADDVIFSLKTFAAAMLAYWIALRFDLSRPFWAVGTVYIVAHPLSGAITSKAVYRLFGTVVGGIMTVALLPNLVNGPWLLIGAIALWVGFCVYISLLDRTPRSYFFLLSGYTVLLAGLPIVDTPQLAFDTAVARVQEIAIAIICAALVSRLVLPRHAGPVLMARADAWLADASKLAQGLLNPVVDRAALHREMHRLAGDSVEMRAFATHVAYDTSPHRDLNRLMHGLQHRMALVLPLLSALRDQHAALAGSPLAERLQREQALLAEWMQATHAGAAAPAPPVVDALMADSPATAVASGPVADEWEVLVYANATRRMADLIDVWRDCGTLRDDLRSEQISRESRRILSGIDWIPPHRDHGMAALAAFAAVATIIVGSVLWIYSGWHNGLFIPQIGGVFCCILATMDNPVPAMRKFLPILLWAMLAAFIYTFAVMPFLQGFLSLAAALGLFLIPAGLFLAIPRTFMVGMGLCINFPFMLALQSRLSLDFVAFVDPNIATMLGVVTAITVCGLVRAVGAETSAFRLLRAGWREVATTAWRPATHGLRLSSRLIDVMGQMASRIAALPADSPLLMGDLLRDLRAGVNLSELRQQMPARTVSERARLARLIDEVAGFYRQRSSVHETIDPAVLTLLDDCLAAARAARAREEAQVLAALRLCLSPETRPAPPALPITTMERVA
ncbi:FUSC family protein [Haematobacter missouriensis]|uniref:FUSC family protein n=1 Tax=Haematobacter missouriensis TaxID=366616 RepID=A0A212AIG0_9RHOB|nr:FUSC family protein [Haematobacter missouriensis]OWJ77795.1 hypothetical protein CDV53_04705 [Haematobacter missouriensis]OWJ81213.1 hypothetical protein CDV52_19140 [Haematobacter missouriensis]